MAFVEDEISNGDARAFLQRLSELICNSDMCLELFSFGLDSREQVFL